MKNQKIILAFSAVILIIAFLVGAKFYKENKAKEMGFLANEKYELFIRDHSPTLGNPEAKVTIIEFLDPECESCRAFYPFVKQIMASYPGKIKLVVRYTPLHGNSKFVVKVLEATRKQGKFWESLEVLFKYQPNWGGHHNPRPELIWEYLPLVGVGIDQVKKDMNSPAIQKILDQDIADSKALGIRMTPAFFVNGKPLTNFGYQQLRDLVDQEIKLTYKE